MICRTSNSKWSSFVLVALLLGQLTSGTPTREDDNSGSPLLETREFAEASKRLAASSGSSVSRNALDQRSSKTKKYCRSATFIEKPPDCPKEFQGKCRCYCDNVRQAEKVYLSNFQHRFYIYTVECVDAAFTDTYMLQFLPMYTEKLIFTGNRLATLTPNLFGNENDYPDLKWVDLSNNQIEAIPGKTFHRVSSVEILFLNNNEISNRTIHDHSRIFSNFKHLKALHLTDAFNDEAWSLSDLSSIFAESDLSKVTKLHLEQNEMRVIDDPNIFCDLVSLHELYLADNLLQDLNINVSCLPAIYYIEAFRNQITSVRADSGVYRILNHQNQRGETIHINLAENPFFCDCNLEPYLTWIKNITKEDIDRIPNHHKLHCADGLPASNRGLNLLDVPRTECQVLQLVHPSTVATTLVWILTLVIIAMAVTLLYCHRKSVAYSVSPLLNPAHGVKYTSIEKNEEQNEIAHV